MDSESIRVMCVEDNLYVAEALERKLLGLEGIHWLGWAKNAAEMKGIALSWFPHVVLLDLLMPGQDCIQMIETLHTCSPNSRVIVLSGTSDEHLAQRAMDIGIRGYLCKGECSETIIDTIRRVAAGESVFGREAADHLMGPVSMTVTPTRNLSVAPKER